MALDSCARLMAPLDRPALGSALAAVAGVSTVSAAGTEASDAAPRVGAGSPRSVATFGSAGVGGDLLQLLNASAAMTKTVWEVGVRMLVLLLRLGWQFSLRQAGLCSARCQRTVSRCFWPADGPCQRFHQFTNKAIKIMIGMGTPKNNSNSERMVTSLA